MRLSAVAVAVAACLGGAHAFSVPLRSRAVAVSLKSVSINGDTADIADAATPTLQTENGEDPFASFDYKAHWYPVSWACDVPLNQPTQVTVFDEDYAIARTSDTDVIAMLDDCPHKHAALSEGRVTECGKNIQCSYHGWSFDGTSGDCVQIPQTVIGGGSGSSATVQAGVVAARIVQGMIWIQPFKTPLEALNDPGPPRVPDMDKEGFKSTPVVRDFPHIDWTVLLENIMDPDHGLFAHSTTMAGKAFDFYISDGTENRQTVSSEKVGENGWTATSRVNAVNKMIKYDQKQRGTFKDDKKKKGADEPPLIATTTFVAPNMVYMGRRDPETNDTKFITAFWICPTGTGRSRFLSAGVGKAALPRWLTSMSLNNFLDQDTFLLLGQQRAILKAEADPSIDKPRKSTYAYRSPTEKMGVMIGQFFDGTLHKAPNRKATLPDPGSVAQLPDRRDVLDRYEQHTRICPDSQKVVRNCEAAQKLSKLTVATTVLVQLYLNRNPTMTNKIFRPVLAGFVLALSTLTNWLAKKIRKQFFFKADQSVHLQDLEGIPKLWMDPK